MHRDTNRPRRVGALIKRELAQVIEHDLDDPRVGQVTVTAVDVAPDLKSAKVYVSCLQGAGEGGKYVAALNRAAGFLRHCLRERVELRGIPGLRFVYDESAERGRRIEDLLARAKRPSPDNR